MITYKTLKTQEDFLKHKQFCEKNNYPFSTKADIVMGAFDEGEMVACCSLKKELVMLDFYNPTKHGHVASVLSEKIFACASLTSDSIMGLATDKDVITIYEKAGAKIMGGDVTVIRKYL